MATATGLGLTGEPMMVLVHAFIVTFNFALAPYAAQGAYAGPSPYVCTPSGAGMQAICREKATG